MLLRRLSMWWNDKIWSKACQIKLTHLPHTFRKVILKAKQQATVISCKSLEPFPRSSRRFDANDKRRWRMASWSDSLISREPPKPLHLDKIQMDSDNQHFEGYGETQNQGWKKYRDIHAKFQNISSNFITGHVVDCLYALNSFLVHLIELFLNV